MLLFVIIFMANCEKLMCLQSQLMLYIPGCSIQPRQSSGLVSMSVSTSLLLSSWLLRPDFTFLVRSEQNNRIPYKVIKRVTITGTFDSFDVLKGNAANILSQEPSAKNGSLLVVLANCIHIFSLCYVYRPQSHQQIQLIHKYN